MQKKGRFQAEAEVVLNNERARGASSVSNAREFAYFVAEYLIACVC